MPENKEMRDLLVELKTINTELLRRMDTFDKIIVPRSEFNIVVQELRERHHQNQVDIENVQEQLRALMWRLGVGLGSLQIVTALAMYLISKGV